MCVCVCLCIHVSNVFSCHSPLLQPPLFWLQSHSVCSDVIFLSVVIYLEYAHTHTHTNHCAATARLLSDTVKCLAYALMLTERQGVRWALSKCKVCLSARISSVFSPYHTHIHSPLSSLALSLSALDKSQAYLVAATNVALSSCEWAQRRQQQQQQKYQKKGKNNNNYSNNNNSFRPNKRSPQ